MAKEVKNRVSLDASRFQRGTAQVKRNIKQLERGLTVDLRKAARIGTKSIAALGAGVAAAGAGISVGIKKAIELGSRLDRLADRTGIAAGELRVLQQAFEDNGVEASSVGDVVSDLQERIVEADKGTKGFKENLDDLGLSSKRLLQLSPAEQFAEVSKALGNVENQALKTQIAMSLFSTEGAKLMGLFGSGAIDEARQSLGTQSKLLDENAALFEQASTLLGRAGSKVEGFFVGVADKVVPVILPLLEKLDGLDLAKKGQEFGEKLQDGLRAVIGLFEQDTLGDLITTSLVIGGKEFINTVARGISATIAGAIDAWKAGFENSVNLFTDGIEKVGLNLKALLLTAIAKAVDSIPFANADLAEARASLARNEARQFRGEGTLDPGELFDKMQSAFAEGAAKFEGINILDVAKDKEKMKRIVRDALDAVPKNEGAAAKAKGEGEGGGTIPSLDGLSGKNGAGVDTGPQFGAASSLARIGGGGGVAAGGVNALVDQSRRQTSALEKIRDALDAVPKNEGALEKIRDALDAVPKNEGAAAKAKGEGEGEGTIPSLDGLSGKNGAGAGVDTGPQFGAASSLARIGDGGGVAAGGVNALVDQSRRQTSALEKIRDETMRQTREIVKGFQETLGVTPVLQ